MTESLNNQSSERTSLPVSVGKEFSVFPPSFANTEITFFYERTVDLSDFNQGEAVFIPELDMSNSKQFSATNRGVNELFQNAEYVEGLKKYTSNPEVIDYLEQMRRYKKLKPIDSTSIPRTAYHAGKLFYSTPLRALFAMPIDSLKRMKNQGYYGRSNGATYFSINRDIALVHGKGSENSPDKHGIGHPKTRLLLLTIDIQKLVKKRNIFIDPESLRMTDEFGVNFVVHQGIPVSAISQLDILQFRRMS